MMDNEAERIAHFEQMGEHEVRLVVENAGFPLDIQKLAIKWLSKKQGEEARRARQEVRRGYWIAVATLIVACLTLIASIYPLIR